MEASILLCFNKHLLVQNRWYVSLLDRTHSTFIKLLYVELKVQMLNPLSEPLIKNHKRIKRID